MKKFILILLLVIVISVLIVYFSFSVNMATSKREKFRFNCFFRPGYYENKLKDQEPSFRIVEKLNFDESERKILSLSLYGTHEKYFKGTENLIQQCKELLPGWKVRIHLHDKVESKVRKRLLETDAQIFIIEDPLVEPGNSSGAFWRYLPACDPVSFVCFDVDEVVAPGFAKAIKHWYDQRHEYPYLKFNYGVDGSMSNIFWPKDHIVGGKWGNSESEQIDMTLITNHGHRSTFGADEAFLYFEISPIATKQGIMTFYPKKEFKLLANLHFWPRVKSFPVEKEMIVSIDEHGKIQKA